jgi:hypothetical protein
MLPPISPNEANKNSAFKQETAKNPALTLELPKIHVLTPRPPSGDRAVTRGRRKRAGWSNTSQLAVKELIKSVKETPVDNSSAPAAESLLSLESHHYDLVESSVVSAPIPDVSKIELNVGAVIQGPANSDQAENITEPSQFNGAVIGIAHVGELIPDKPKSSLLEKRISRPPTAISNVTESKLASHAV